MFDKEDQTEALELDETEAVDDAVEEDVSEPDLEDTEAEDDHVEEEGSDEEEGQDPEAQEDEGEAFTVSFGDAGDAEEKPEAAPEWARELRKRHRDTAKENKELKAKLEALESAKEVVKLGEKPTLAGCEYDEDKFDAELVRWHEQKREVEAQKQAEADAQRAEQQAWQERVEGYNEGKAKLATQARDFEEAEEEVRDTFSPIQQGAILHIADDAPLLVYALGKNPKKAQELAAIKDQALFIKAVTRLESTMKATNVKTAPKPERRVGGTGGAPRSATNALEKARAKAAETGDYTEVRKIKARMRDQAK